MNTPNLLTMYRILAIPFIVILLSFRWDSPWAYAAALVIFVSCVVSDVADGRIARHNNLVTDFGKFMDPLADKMLVCSVLICFTWLDLLPAWFVIIVVAREFAISGFRAVAAEKNKVIAANRWGKIKSQFQYNAIITILVILISGYTLTWEWAHFEVTGDIEFFKWFFMIYSNIVIWLMVVFTIISLFTYMRDNWGLISEDM